ncbi:MAG: serine/threonine protein kinase [Planctomycetes bacterium]|nr:serine/threonine protein kinase [Planctomycetota bacterium]
MPDDKSMEDETYLDSLSEYYDFAQDSSTHREELPIYKKARIKDRNYKADTLLARGGMKEVYKVYDEKMGRHLALARLQEGAPELLYEPFLREAALTALLDHPNIITVFDYGLDDVEGPFFTMELKTGHGFDQLLKDQTSEKRDLKRLLDIFLRICDGIAFAHSRQVLHLDLKPANIQIGQYGEVVVCDWGLGKVMGKSDINSENFDQLLINPDLLNEVTLSGKIRGTPGYMAPEQILKGGEKSKQTDIYALGSILYHILMGKTPHQGSTDEILNKTVEGDVVIPDSVRLSLGLRSILLKALAKDIEMRYSCVEDMQKDIENYIRGYSTLAENPNIFTELNLFYRRHALVCQMVLGFVFIFTLGTSLFLYHLEQSRQETKEAREVVETVTEVLVEKKQWREMELVARSKNHSHYQYFQNPKKNTYLALEVLEEALRIKPNSNEAKYHQAEMFFISQDFPRSLGVLQDLSNRSTMEKLSRRFQNASLNKEGLLEFSLFSDCILQLADNEWNYFLIERMIAYDQQQRRESVDYKPLVKATFMSQIWGDDVNFKYDETTKSLSLQGQGIRSLLSHNKEQSGESILRFLDIVRLDLRGSKIQQLDELEGLLKLRELDIRNTSVKSVLPLNRFHVLNLIINDGQFKKEQLDELEGWIEVSVFSE